METPNSSKPNKQQNKLTDNGEISNQTTSNSNTKFEYPLSYKRTPSLLSLEQNVDEFEKTARYMIKTLDATRDKIENIIAADDVNYVTNIEHLKFSIQPNAATLISQGDTLVLETHGKSSVLSNRVMKTQSLLREKLREVQQAK